jgi:hypothetical protein
MNLDRSLIARTLRRWLERVTSGSYTARTAGDTKILVTFTVGTIPNQRRHIIFLTCRM